MAWQAVNSRARNTTRTPLNNRQRRPGYLTIVEAKFLPGQSGVYGVFRAGRRNRVNFWDCEPGRLTSKIGWSLPGSMTPEQLYKWREQHND